jgi:hypothetical protein
MLRLMLLVIIPLAFFAGSVASNHGQITGNILVGSGALWVFCWMLWLLGSVFNPFKGRRESLFD